MRTIDDERRIQEVREARQGEAAQARKMAIVLLEILRPFTKAVHNSGNMFEAKVSTTIQRSEPVAFSAFWGVGGKYRPDEHDKRLLDELASIKDVVTSRYHLGADIQLMLADAHGKFNGFSSPQVYEYLVRIQDDAKSMGIESVWLSELYKQWNLTLPDSQEPIDRSSEFFNNFWDKPDYHRQRDQLIESASKHNLVGVEPYLAAYHYGRMRKMEAPYLEAMFPQRILLVNTSKDLGKPLLPNGMPHMYLRVAPAWFLGVN